MEHHFSSEAQSDYYDPYLQQAERMDGWSPINLASGPLPSPPPPPRSRVSFAPVSTPLGATTETPSSVGLGIGPAGHDAQLPGYYPVPSRDSFQQDGGRPLAADSPKPSVSPPQEYTLNSPYGAYNSPQHHDGPSPPGGLGRFFGLTGSKPWKMMYGGWPMYTPFCLGIAFAVAHHAFYASLHGKPADDQIRMMQLGGFLSYAAKASLVATVVFAYRQQIWVTVIAQILRLRTIDSLFAALDEPVTMLNWEFIKKGRIAACLAILAWLFPLTVILTPATLTVVPLTEIRDDRCPGVRTLNFGQEMTKNWRDKDLIGGFREISVSLWNSTLQDSSHIHDPFNTTFFDYWTDSSKQVTLVADQSVLTGSVIPRPNAAVETCGSGWNCSYTISFKAPGYNCTELIRGPTLSENAVELQGLPIDVSHLVPMGNWSYIASTNLGEYSRYQLNDTWPGGAPKTAPPFPKYLGAFRTEPVVVVGYSVAKDPRNLPENKTVSGWAAAYEAIVFRCDHYLINYTVQFNHTSTQQTTTVLNREPLHPIINTTLVGQPANDISATPESNYVLPLDVGNYRLTGAYHSIGKLLRGYLEGIIQYAPYADIESNAVRAGLIDMNTYLPVPDLMSQIQSLYENMTLSLFSNPQFLVVSWAADPSQRSGAINSTEALAYPCVKTRVVNAYIYNSRDLWIAYSVAICVACLAVVLGSAALSQNNFRVRDVHVSSIVAATRAPCLESLPWKASKWGEVSDDILDMKLGYGVITEPGPNGTPAAVDMGHGWAGTPGVLSGKVYYGFAPRDVLERTRAATFGPGKPRSRASAFSFSTWEQHYHSQG